MTPFFTQKTKYRKNQTTNSGFTLVELLAVVAILLLVGLIAVFSLNKLRRTLRQHELDAKAQIIYVAAQNRLAELRAAGQEALCINGFDNSDSIVHKMEYDPRHMDESAKNTDFYYLLVNDTSDKSQTAATALLPSSAVDQELWNGYWCIEFAPETGSIYAVFYSETTLPDHDDLNTSYRNFNYRLKTTSVGYYGGDIAQTQDISKFNPSITIENAEKLIVTFYCNNPVSEKMTFKIDISDKDGGTFTRTITNFAQLDKYNYKYQWILDSLAAEKGIGNAGAARFAAQTNYQVSRGTPITITLTVSSANPSVDTVSTSRTTNGLFDDRADLSYGENTALVSCGRHLANLDSSSGVNSTITSAVQISDISFSDDPADPSDWYSLYTAKGVNFKPISNIRLTSYVGSSSIDGITSRHTINGLTVSSNSPAGLFSNFSGEISDVTLVNANISSTSAAGALVGRATGNLKLANCRVYLADSDLSNMKAASADKIPSRITGTHAGGLVGVYENSSAGNAQANGTLIIENSFAATTINSTTAAGGLVGHAAGAVSVSQSYADCYLTAPVTGGLVGMTTGSGGLTLSDSYAAGYQTATDGAAGFVAGYLTKATNSYSACAYLGNPQAVYTTAKTSTNIATDIKNVFYLTSGLDGKQHTDITGTGGRSYAEMIAAQFLTDLSSTAFMAASADTTHPYNLLGQGLSTYSYPRLVKLSHYGDWQAEFETEALVYYERYNNNSVGFFGGNVDNLADDKTIVGDGYAVALSAPLTGSLTVMYNGKSVPLSDPANSLTSSYGGTTYYLYPVDMLTTSTDTATTNFYHSVTVNGRTYQFNPYFAKTVTTGSGTRAPASVYLRTARHLYELSRHYGGLAAATANTTFRQECDISYTSYLWADYTSYGAVSTQTPITGTAENAGDTGGFRAVYDGGGHTIRGVSFASAGNDVGMFAVVAPTGTVRNVALLSDSSSNTSKSTVERSGLIQGSTTVVYMGALAGRNYGTVSNCAVSGYALGGASGVAAYQHSTVYLGGLVGGNLYHKTHSGRIVSSEANCPLAEVSAYSAAVYAGGFTGSNAGGSIQSCYALGVLKARDVSASTVRLCGFAGENAGGALAYCYSATALTAAGEAEVYGLTRTGGSAAQCFYLDGGTYAYGEGLYAYNASGNSFRVNAAQSPINGANLETQSLYGFTKLTASGTEAVYPYPAVVRDAAGKTVHYGPWPEQRHIGTMGVFYWEREQGGNAGYHLSYVGTDNGVAFSGSTLCVQHNDSGVVMEYGYGYFYKKDSAATGVTLSASPSCHLGAVNEAAGSALKAQMPEYEFVAYTTGAGQATDTEFTGAMYLTGKETNCTWTLKYGDAESVYTLCPFFADAMSLDSITDTPFSDAHKPGTAGKPYQVRSVSQLQNINWNYGTKSVDHSITSSNDENITKYPYLGSYRNSVGWGEDKFGNQTRRYWVQSHDLDAAAEYKITNNSDHLFTPIGNMVDTRNDGGKAQPYVSFFCSDYDGGAYTTRNVQIESTAQCVGLFGYTIGANLKDIVMYSDRASEIVNGKKGTGWYAVGGLVGFAGAGKDNASFTNCSVSGYTIRDIRENPSGWGGGCVGGLVGATNMNITGCTAVTDIELNPGYNTAWNNLRVGGIAGVCRATLDKCYAGGSITVGKLNTYHSGYGNSTSIWVGGLVGGIILRDHGSLESYMGATTNALTVRNSYAFVELPPLNNDANKNHVKATYSIASNGEMLNAFAPVTNSVAYIKNCYALIDTAANANDYNAFGKSADTNWAAELDLNHYTKNGENNRQEKQRRVLITNNGKTPYITYEQMQTELKDWLNGGESTSTLKFGTVTVTENGAPIPGKYSFPGANAEMLDGLDFPFPTILTQKDVAGRTVNVHYGRWPTSGLYWERTRTTLDLCADRSGEGAPTLTVALYQYPAVAEATDMPKIALVNDTDGQTSDLLDWTAPVYNSAERCWEVTFTGKGRTGLVIAQATLGGHTAEMTIDVTQTLLLTSDKAASGVSVRYGGESETVQLTLADAKNRPIAAKQGESLTWEVTATKQGGGYDPGDESIVECSAVTAVDAANGLYQFTVSGFSGGISTVSVTCMYTYPEGTGQKSVTARLLLNAKSTRDAVGLVYDLTEDTRVYTIANGEYRSELNDTSKAGRADVTVPEFSREVGKLYLFAGSGYTELGDFEVVTSGLSAVDAEGKTVAVTATPGAIQTAEGVQYREVTFIGTDEALISGDIVLTHKTDGAVYTLHLEKYTYKPTT